jgi:hypothetical protein
MRVMLTAAVAAALVAASAAFGTSSSARIWLVTPTTVSGSGFPAGKVTVTARLPADKAVEVVRASGAGRFSARFETSLRSSSCAGVTVSAVGLGGARAVLKIAGRGKNCPPPFEP